VSLLALGSTDVSAAASRQVLLVHGFPHPYFPWSETAASFRAELIEKSPVPIDLYEVSIDSEKYQDPKDERPFVEYIRALLSGRKLDLIVPVGAPAISFVQRHRVELFPDTPALDIAGEVRRASATLTKNETAVMVQENLADYVENMLHLLPDTSEVAVVIGDSPVEHFWAAEWHHTLSRWAERVKFTWFNDLTFGEILQRASRMPPHSAILWITFNEDAAGVPYPPDRALIAMRQVANAPIFGMTDSELGRGIIGGPLLPTQVQGEQAAKTALRILSGESPHDIKPVAVGYPLPIRYDARELRRWGIREDLLPRGSIVQYREPNAWQRYRWQILSATTVMLLQAALILRLLYERRRRRSAEIEAQTRFSELAHMNRRAAVGELSASIAHELRQPVSIILRASDVAKMILNEPSPDLNELKEIVDDIDRANERSGEIIKRTQRLLSKKAPLELLEIDLDGVLRDTFELLTPQASVRGVTLSVDLASPAPRVNGDVIQLQQVILNLVINALDAITGANSPERRITGRTAIVDNTAAAEVSIEDSGPGIPIDKLEHIFDTFFTTKEGSMGMGLSISRTIVESHGGRIWAENQRGGGAAFRFSLPIAEHGAKVARKSAESVNHAVSSPPIDSP